LAISSYRKKKIPSGRLDVEAAGALVDPEVGAAGSAGIWAAARNLGGSQYRVLWLRYGEDMTIEAIAASLGKSRLAVRLLLHRARKNLMRRVCPAPVMATATKTAAIKETPLG
jgi:DNA-directed RNA polymerase specialized sigma24 family protein